MSINIKPDHGVCSICGPCCQHDGKDHLWSLRHKLEPTLMGPTGILYVCVWSYRKPFPSSMPLILPRTPATDTCCTSEPGARWDIFVAPVPTLECACVWLFILCHDASQALEVTYDVWHVAAAAERCCSFWCCCCWMSLCMLTLFLSLYSSRHASKAFSFI